MNKKTPCEEVSGTSSDYDKWDSIYRRHPLNSLGWELGKPRPILVEFVNNGTVKPSKALDLCCGAGTNTIYLARQGFDVSGFDVSINAIRIARKKALHAGAKINFGLHSFVSLPFQEDVFDFVFDMGCFHHVMPKDRNQFIGDVTRILRSRGTFMLTCFSKENGINWNHFSKEQLSAFFGQFFEFNETRHYASLEGDGYTRFFYTILMRKK